MAIELVYETHAITTDNEDGIATGWLPGRLSEAGLRTAAELGERRRLDGITKVYVSDLERAVQTARIAFAGESVPIVVDARLRECNYGRRNGMPKALLDAERRHHIEEPWPDGESYRDVVVRTADLLADVARGDEGSRILLIAHSANQWAIDHLLLGSSLPDVVAAGMTWQAGWEYNLPVGWSATSTDLDIRDRQGGTSLPDDPFDE